MSRPAIASYLQAGRLADVLALIQVLAYDRHSYRSESGVTAEMQRGPAEGDSWLAVAREHPEFFRVRKEAEDREPRVALLSRYVLDRTTNERGEEIRAPLDPVVANKLMELAVNLHDKQLERRIRWRTVGLPLIVASISALTVLTAAFIRL